MGMLPLNNFASLDSGYLREKKHKIFLKNKIVMYVQLL